MEKKQHHVTSVKRPKSNEALNDYLPFRAVQFLLYDLSQVYLARKVLGRVKGAGLDPHEKPLDFLSLCFRALNTDMWIRVVRVLEQNPQKVASFWYIYDWEQKFIEEQLRKRRVDVRDIARLSDRVKRVRDKSFVHIDKKHVLTRQALYSDASITLNEAEHILDALWFVLNELFRAYAGIDFPLELETAQVQIVRQLEDLMPMPDPRPRQAG